MIHTKMTTDDESSERVKDEVVTKSESSLPLFKDIELKIEKYSWESYLKTLKNLIKICYLKANEKNVPARLKKGKLMQKYVEILEDIPSLNDLAIKLVRL